MRQRGASVSEDSSPVLNQAFDREAGKLVVAEYGDLRLRHSQHLGGFGLRQFAVFEHLIQRNHLLDQQANRRSRPTPTVSVTGSRWHLRRYLPQAGAGDEHPDADAGVAQIRGKLECILLLEAEVLRA